MVGLVGNPNSGKSSLFNALTGMRQRVANFPGVTVEKKIGSFETPETGKVKLIDFPGLYSIYPNSSEEQLVVELLLDKNNELHPEGIIYVADATNLERHLLLASQLKDLGFSLFFVLNMEDLVSEPVLKEQTRRIKSFLACPVFSVSSKFGTHIQELKVELGKWISRGFPSDPKKIYMLKGEEKELLRRDLKIQDDESYYDLVTVHHHEWLTFLAGDQRDTIQGKIDLDHSGLLRLQIEETLDRFELIKPLLYDHTTGEKSSYGLPLTHKLDAILTNRFTGVVIFFSIMFLVFQAIFSFAEYPMQWIEQSFIFLGASLRNILGYNWFGDLFIDGILAGLSGVLVFIPQIAILFFLISLLEEVGYMSRAVYMFDHIMRKFGLNGRSIVALISSGACAIPAIMSTRTISNWKERIITILVSPLISCSARIPVYTILIGFAVPNETVFGIFNLQGIAFMGLYLLGIIMAFVSALLFKYILKNKERSFLIIELPVYKAPIWRNVFLNIKEKVFAFITEAGKIIMLISVILWFLASTSLPGRISTAETNAKLTATEAGLEESEIENHIEAAKVEASFAGILGKTIEPVIKPLGYDWKMGIALITSFAAREVFVGTMATIYSVGSSEDELSVRERMRQEINPSTGKPVYDIATSFSLLIFYVFAMQCMSTLAVTRKETGSWKWPLIQFTFMGVLAYFGSLLTYTLLS